MSPISVLSINGNLSFWGVELPIDARISACRQVLHGGMRNSAVSTNRQTCIGVVRRMIRKLLIKPEQAGVLRIRD